MNEFSIKDGLMKLVELKMMQISLSFTAFYSFKIKNQRFGKTVVQLFYCCNSEKNYDVLKSKSLCI